MHRIGQRKFSSITNFSSFGLEKSEELVIVYSRMKAGVPTDSSSVGVQYGIAKLIDQRLFHQLPHKFLNSHFTISTSIPVAM